MLFNIFFQAISCRTVRAVITYVTGVETDGNAASLLDLLNHGEGVAVG